MTFVGANIPRPADPRRNAVLLDSMGDKQSFDIQFEGQSVAHIGWTDGFTAGDRLLRCVGARR